MMLIRLLILCLIGWLIGRGLRNVGAPRHAPRSPAGEPFVPMARCRRCGVHLPESDLSAGGHCRGCDTVH